MKKESKKVVNRGELFFGDLKISCAVLSDGTRVISDTGINNVFGRAHSDDRKQYKKRIENEKNLPVFYTPDVLIPFIAKENLGDSFLPVEYKNGTISSVGYKAEALTDVCKLWVEAAIHGSLNNSQLTKAKKAQVIINSILTVGITSLVDEATGYQAVRPEGALQQQLDALLERHATRWTKRFPEEFYIQMHRLMGWDYPGNFKMNSYAGVLTNKIIYELFPTGMLEEIQVRNKKQKVKQHQFLSEIGVTELKDKISRVCALMSVASDWPEFEDFFQKSFAA